MPAPFDHISRDPVNATAARVVSKGTRWQVGPFRQFHSEFCPPLRKELPHNCFQLAGLRVGRFIVVGYAAETNRWIVRCTCGAFEHRKTKALQNPANQNDRCQACRRIDQAKRSHQFHTHGRNF